jgi:hypothetical protein
MIYSLGIRTVDGTIAAPNWEIRTGATPGRAKLLEIGFFLVAATASQLGLGRPAAIGTVPTAPVNFLPEDPNDIIAAGVLQSAVAWGGAPTVPLQHSCVGLAFQPLLELESFGLSQRESLSR